jgi:CheY-like chemotaxis protein
MTGFRKKVLWVDDEIERLRAHILFLETRGYTVVPVFSGDDAIQLVKEQPDDFDIVLLDEQMPGKDGLTTLEEIKAIRPDLPVVMVTKSEEENVMEQALGKKIDGYLTKPVNPSQILIICKRLLDSKQFIAAEVKQRFLRNFSENATALRGHLGTQEWTRLYENLARWDAELDTIDDEGIRQTHAGQKSIANAAFSEFIIDRYGNWVKGENKPPVLSVGAMEKYVDPLLRDSEPVYLIIISGMRLDQYIGIEDTVRRYFKIQRNYFYSILPTSPRFARSAFFSGCFPDEIAGKYPDDWKKIETDRELSTDMQQSLIKDHMSIATIALPGGFACVPMTENETFHTEIDKHNGKKLTVIVADFVHLLTGTGSQSAIAQEIAPDDRALRSITRAWFEHSSLLQLLKKLSAKKCTVVLTSDHGTVYCALKTEVYGVRQLERGYRYRFGRDIRVDSRHVVELNDAKHYRLPSNKKTPQCIIAKENYYFTLPENFKEYHHENRNSFQQGGISMEEMIVPIGIFTPL